MNYELTKSNLKIAWRNLMKYRLQTLISILSLAVGMVCFSLSALWLRYIEGFDKFHPGAERIYMVLEDQSFFVGRLSYSSTEYMPEYLSKNMPEVEYACSFYPSRLNGSHYAARLNGGDKFPLDVNMVDTAFFSMFDVHLLDGQLKSLTSDEIIITRSLARRLFGDASPIGKQIAFHSWWDQVAETDEYDDRFEDMTIVGVVEEWPSQSLFHFDALVAKLEYGGDAKYSTKTNISFARLHSGIQPDMLVQKFRGNKHDWGGNQTDFPDFRLIPIGDVLRQAEPEWLNVKVQHVWYFMLLGVVVILCALCNYLVSMVSVVRSRSREMAMRRLFGSSVWGLTRLVVTETLLIFLFSSILGLCIIWMILPEFRDYSGVLEPLGTIGAEIVSYMLLTTMSGLILTAVTVRVTLHVTQRSVLQGRTSRAGSAMVDRIGVWIQIAIGLATAFCVGVMLLQLHYMLHTNSLGFNRDNVGLLRKHGGVSKELAQFVRQSPLVDEVQEGASSPFPEPMSISMPAAISENGDNEELKQFVKFWKTDVSLYPFYGIELIDGRFPEPGKNEVLLSEASCLAEGWENPIGKHLSVNGRKDIAIVGIVPDIYQYIPTRRPDPVVYTDSEDIWGGDQDFIDIIFRAKPGRLEPLIEQLKDHCAKILADERPQVINVEEIFYNILESERLLTELLSFTSAICIFISLAGVFSMLSLSLQRRRKEVALRKIHGAKVRDIFRLFLSEYVWLLLGAAVVAFPVGFYLMHQWLSQYTRQVPFAWWLCPAILLAMAALILLTVFWQIWRAAKANAAEVIKE